MTKAKAKNTTSTLGLLHLLMQSLLFPGLQEYGQQISLLKTLLMFKQY